MTRTFRPTVFAALVLIGGLIPGSLNAGPASSDVAKDEGHLLAERWCSSCHLVAGSSTGTDAVPTFQAIADRMATTEAQLKGYLLKPHGEMPDFQLSFPHIDRIIAYILSLRARN